MPWLLIALLCLTGCGRDGRSQTIITPSGAEMRCDFYQEKDGKVKCVIQVGLMPMDSYTAYEGPAKAVKTKKDTTHD